MSLDFDKIRYKNKNYAVIKISYKDVELPTVVDWDDFVKIRKLKKSWKTNNMGFVSCKHTYNNVTKELFLHEIIMAWKMKSQNKKPSQKPVVHLNKIGLDNRRENLLYDIQNKPLNKNIKKKSRTIELPKNSGISLDEIPTYVWYMKPDSTHGERFMVEVGNVKWKTTSSKKLSLRYKLEEAKLFLRQLKDEKPHLFTDYSMNGDFTKEGINMLDSYYDIIHRAGYTHIKRYKRTHNTDNLLKVGAVTKKEKLLLKQQGGLISVKGGTKQRRRVVTNLPKNSGIDPTEIPQYCYYRPSYKNRGDYFVVEKGGRYWQTSSAKNVSIKEKFNQLLEYVDNMEGGSYSESSSDSSDLSISSESSESSESPLYF